MNYLALVKLIVSLLPVLIEAVKAVEAAIPQSGQGQAKLAAVQSILGAAWKASSDATVAFEQVWPALSAAVSAVVAAFNAAGIFKKAA